MEARNEYPRISKRNSINFGEFWYYRARSKRDQFQSDGGQIMAWNIEAILLMTMGALNEILQKNCNQKFKGDFVGTKFKRYYFIGA